MLCTSTSRSIIFWSRPGKEYLTSHYWWIDGIDGIDDGLMPPLLLPVGLDGIDDRLMPPLLLPVGLEISSSNL